jgi:hypothetical protein
MSTEDKANAIPEQEDVEGHRFVLRPDDDVEEEDPSVMRRVLEADDNDDVQGHRIYNTGDAGPDAPGHVLGARIGAIDDDDVEGHHFVKHSSDPDFAAKSLGHIASAKDDDEDVEGHLVKL